MIELIWFVLAVLASPFESKSRLKAENAVLRHQLIVLRRKVRGRAQLTNNDRWFLVQMYPSILTVVTIVQPETAGAVASGRLSSLLALEIEPAGRAPANRDGIARADPADERGEPALGCATHPRRTAQAWVPLADGVALEGIRIIDTYLPRAVENGRDLEARAYMFAAASMGATRFRRDSRSPIPSGRATTPITA